jgi:plasmid stabilization system protein ParE
LPPLPFLIIYRVLPEAVEIVRILHAAQRWP